MLFICSPPSVAGDLGLGLGLGFDFPTTSFIFVQSTTFPGSTVRTIALPFSSYTLAPGAAAFTRYKQGNVCFLATWEMAGTTSSSDKSISSATSAALSASRCCAARSARARASFAWMSPRHVGQDCCCTSHSRKQCPWKQWPHPGNFLQPPRASIPSRQMMQVLPSSSNSSSDRTASNRSFMLAVSRR